jgi:anti-anti-sigma factor
MQSENRHQLLFLTPDGAIDAASAAEMLEQVRLARDDGLRHVIVDFHAAPWMASAGLAALIEIAASLRHVDGSLAVTGASEQTHALLQVSGLSHLLLQFDTVADAERHLRQLPAPHAQQNDEDDGEDEHYENEEDVFDDD